MAIHLFDNLVSAKLLIPLDEDFPCWDKTLRIHTRAKLAFTDGRPVVSQKGVSVMGVALFNAWLDNLKDLDLVQEFGDTVGVEHLHIEEGRIIVRLRK